MRREEKAEKVIETEDIWDFLFVMQQSLKVVKLLDFLHLHFNRHIAITS